MTLRTSSGCGPRPLKCWLGVARRDGRTLAERGAITQQRRFPESFVREIEERFGNCLDTDYSASRRNGMSGIVAGKEPNDAERVHRRERAPRCGLDCRPNMRAEPTRATIGIATPLPDK
jgi:hypothetical protein